MGQQSVISNINTFQLSSILSPSLPPRMSSLTVKSKCISLHGTWLLMKNENVLAEMQCLLRYIG